MDLEKKEKQETRERTEAKWYAGDKVEQAPPVRMKKERSFQASSGK